MLEGELGSWLVGVGDAVETGAPIAELETEKISGTIEAPGTGIVRRLLAAPGDVLPMGAMIGVIADPTATEAEIDEFLALDAADPRAS